MTRWIAVLAAALASSACGVYGPPVRSATPPAQSAPDEGAPAEETQEQGVEEDEESHT